MYVLKRLKQYHGIAESATNQEIINGILKLSRTEGIFTEPAGGTEVAVAKKLIETRRIPHDESIVISITGNGYKTLETVTSAVEKPYAINATLENFDELFHRLTSGKRATAVAG